MKYRFGVRVEAFHPVEHMLVVLVVPTGVEVVLDAGLADAHTGPAAVDGDVRGFHIHFLPALDFLRFRRFLVVS